MSFYDDNTQFKSLMNILRGTETTFNMNRILMQKIIDSSWVEAIEKGLVHVDNVLRNPGRTIVDIEEIVPIALSRKITVESVKHLAQHTDLIQSVDEVTGKITPSKILNVHKEESLMTYENKFVNTLIERLYVFINVRYEKLAKVTNDGEIFTMGFTTSLDDKQGGKTKIEIHIENEHELAKRGHSSYNVWKRVEKLKKAIEGYKESELCKTLGNTYIRPPVMRTNAIMKNIDLKACLTLWRYIESYDKVGYEINIENSAMSPNQDFVDDFYKLIGLHMLLFRASASTDQELLETKKLAPIEPKVIKQFENIGARFNVAVDASVGYGSHSDDKGVKIDPNGDGSGLGSGLGIGKGGGANNELPENYEELAGQIALAIQIEKAYREELRVKELAEQREAEERERRRLEEERIEAERQAELKRIAEKEAERQRQIREMLERERLAQEAAERERQKLEQERLALLEERRKKQEEERARLEEERLQRALEEAEDAEWLRIARELYLVRIVLAPAYGMDPAQYVFPQAPEPKITLKKETPAEIVLRVKKDQQRREKERAEAERAHRYDTERRYYESKTFEEIYREYSKNPIYALVRLITHILVMVFGIIPKNTDRPDYKNRRVMLAARKEEDRIRKDKRSEMEVYYKKYAQSFKYKFRRDIQDYKFRRKRLKNLRKNRPVYKTNLTPEQQKARQKEMRALYKAYRVSPLERMRRRYKSMKEKWAPRIEKIKTMDKKPLKKIANVLLFIFLVFSISTSIYVTACTLSGKVVNVFGYSVLRVETGSMEPALHVGDYIVTKKCDPTTLEVGDIISYYSEQSDIEGMLVTHRIVEVLDDGTFITHGDANPINDSIPVKAENILGVFKHKSKLYMWIGSFADTNKLFLLFVLLPLTLVSIYELRSLIQIGSQTREVYVEEAEKIAKARYEQKMRRAIDAEKKRLAEEHYRPEDDEVDDP